MSQETGRVKSRVRVRQVGEEQGTVEYEDEPDGLNKDPVFGVFLQWR